MKFSALLLVGIAMLAGCGTTATNNSNIRGTNTNTGYMTNAETNAKPTVPANATNVSPGSLAANSNTNMNSNANSNRKP